jgi:predicted acyltransferase (DUF342 family)
MREERGTITGDVVVAEDYTLWGTIVGNVRVIDGGKMYVRGSIYGKLNVETGGRVHVYGNVARDLVVHKGAKVIHSGVLGGVAVNRGGRLLIDATGRVAGKVKTKSGETKVENPGVHRA